MTRIAVIEVAAPCDWLNSNKHRVRMAEARMAAAWRDAAHWAAKATFRHTYGPAAYPIPFQGCVRIVAKIWKPIDNRYDPGNYYPTAKACVDGLRDYGLLVDDDWKHVDGPDMRHGGKGTPRLVITIEELG